MSSTAVALVLVSAVLHVSWNVLTKSSASPRAFSLLKGTALMVLGLAVLPSLPLGAIPGPVWWCVVLSGVLHALYIVALSTAYETGEISYVYPIARAAPAFVPVAAYLLLDERISLRGGLGIGIVVASVLVIQFRGQGPAAAGGGGLWQYARRRESFWAWLTLLTVVGFTLVDKRGMGAFHASGRVAAAVRGPAYFLLENTLCFALFWVYALCRRGLHLRAVWGREWGRILVAAGITVASYSTVLHVMQTEEVSYVITLRQSSVLMAVAVGWLGLGESAGPVRLAAAGAMCAGLVLVATAG